MHESFEKIKTYCNSLTKYSRYKTREVKIGDIPCGGNNPIRIQSMTITDTMDTKGTVEQTIRMVDAGCEYVRITAPSKLEAENLANIKKELRARGYNVPLVADIHFTPNAAEVAARIVEKVRINPGNYLDRKKFEIIEYSDTQYEEEIEKIRKRFSPLVKICKEYGTAMRIGTNHGSLSDRIMSRYGDTPYGMVESALEFVRICEELDYHQIVLSMKSSNPQVMVQAYRLLVQKMEEEGMNYPLHLGVTEAGGGEDGRIKSAVGIGALLEDGLGDTIRVSLTEDPEFEAPVAISLAQRYSSRNNHKPIKEVSELPYDPLVYSRRSTFEIAGLGGVNVPAVVADFGKRKIQKHNDLNDIGYFYNAETDKWNMNDSAADFIFLGYNEVPFDIPNGLKPVYYFNKWSSLESGIPLLTSIEYLNYDVQNSLTKFIEVTIDDLSNDFIKRIAADESTVLVLTTRNEHAMPEIRRAFMDLVLAKAENPVIIKRSYNKVDVDQIRLYSATDFGALLIDGFGDGVWMETVNIAETESSPGIYTRSFIRNKDSAEKTVNRVLFGILQAARVRISKTEYIACPSCGRTLFDLQETTEMIRKRTEHLKGVKIAIMGCIVNGPGEMADADYGYVGSGVGKITLYREKEIVKRNVPSENAVTELINLIREDGRWIEAKSDN